MSAWMCGAAHWSALADLVSANVDDRTPEEIFLILAQANKDSIDCRYVVGIAGDPDYMYDHEDPFDGGYRARTDGLSWSQDEAAMLAGCYDYQSCEHAGWEGSEAHALITRLMEWAVGSDEHGLAYAAATERVRSQRAQAFNNAYAKYSLWGISWDTLPLSAVQQ